MVKGTREKIRQASLEVIAKRGYTGFSLGVVAEHLSISKGVVTYHFPRKDLIFVELVEGYFRDAAEYMGKHMVIDRSAIDALESYVDSNLRYVAENRHATLAIIHIIANHRGKDGELAFADKDNGIYQPLIEIFEYGQQEEKCFRAFKPGLMAMLVRSAIDTLSGRIATGGIKDLDEAIKETIRTFTLATRRDGNEQDLE
ncbi:TetR/AcrR family transcriptional regulator [Paenibacillus glycanilyticus]|uniref:TetR/AcrR family transcriptional regulator n=1 Tax=Paenibacillus glycanilyticus TaxID=126569 RepID=UPI00203A65B1|nr:TetR/AcrR family transcriptional regulator [Paenibacillus glycanilyticus]MCM3629665.1 TetR/AcrR family transcriptional regulator [Paenibacillus glycanilyticus]